MKKLLNLSLGIVLPLFFTAINGCKHTVDVIPETKKIQLLKNDSLGNYMADKDGRTLYFFSNDSKGLNTCTGGCEALWPPYNTDTLTAADLADGISLNDFTRTTTASGRKQLVYKGWPLYYYAPVVNGINTLEKPGQTTGENVGGVWFVSKPDYTIMLANAQLVGSNGKSYTSTYTEGTGRTIYFTDANGVTLYTHIIDKFNKNNFTLADFSNNPIWPIFENQKVVVPSTIDKTLFSLTDVFGRKQLSYKGWPLYYFRTDSLIRGLNRGVSVGTPGTWPVVVKSVNTAPQ